MESIVSPIHPWILVAGILVTGILSSAALPLRAGAQQVTVTGMVVERTESSWIGGATVRLSGSPPFFTDLGGAFRFARVTPGRHTLTVEALGYQSRSMELEIRADTVLVIEMDPDPILLDSLLVRAGNITIRGEILDAATGQRVLVSQVSVEPGISTVGAVSGYFTVRKVPRGRAVTVLVEALEYMPARIALITETDTTLTIELVPDPVAVRMVAEQVKKLETRSNAVPLRIDEIGREDWAVAPNWSVFDLLRTRLGGSAAIGCLFIDEAFMGSGSLSPPGERGIPGAAQLLHGLFAPEVERIEVFGHGGMVRVYTKRFVHGMMLGQRKLKPIFYGMGACR